MTVGHVADGECLVAGGGQLVHCTVHGILFDVGEDDGGVGEGVCGPEAMPELAPVTSAT